MDNVNYTQFSEDSENNVTPEVTELTVNINDVTPVITEDPEVTKNVEPEPTIKEIKDAIVTGCSKLNLRQEPSKTANIVCVLEKDDEVTVDLNESTEEFYKVYACSNEVLVEGYCVKSFITIK